MSTRGAFIIRKNGIDKELYIPFDAYPSEAGRDAVLLVKTLNLDLLYDLLVPSTEVPCDEPAVFSAERCERAVASHLPFCYLAMDSRFILDSLMCEHAYAVNLDDGVLEYYRGFQKQPQEGNLYGVTPNSIGYYPCRLAAKFPFGVIQYSDTYAIVQAMEECR